jgi:hypothetical protein
MTKLYTIIGRIAMLSLLLAAITIPAPSAAADRLGTSAGNVGFLESVWTWIGSWLPDGNGLAALFASNENTAPENTIGVTEEEPPPIGFGFDPNGRTAQ